MSASATATELEQASPEVKRYQRLKLLAGAVSAVIGLGWLALLALWLGPHIAGWLDAVVGNRWLRLLVMAGIVGIGAELLTLPLDFWSGFILEHRFRLSNQSFAKWVWKRTKGYLVGGPLGLALLAGLYALLWYAGDYWWLWVVAGYLLVTLVLARLAPVLILPLFIKVTPLEARELRERLDRLVHGTGLSLKGIYRLHLSEDTKKANAALAGLGRTRRVLLGDTLLEQFTADEIEVVFAHEIGHHVFRHLPKMIVVSVLLSVAGFWLVDQVLTRFAAGLGYADFRDPAALPLILLVLAVFGLILLPLQNALSRFFERQCDRYALERTRMPAAYKSAFTKLAQLNKSDPTPNRLVVWAFYDHPPIGERIAMADTVG